ncbi:hypothetical protein K8Z49_01190 [Actinomadura madurae]
MSTTFRRTVTSYSSPEVVRWKRPAPSYSAMGKYDTRPDGRNVCRMTWS